MSDAPFPDAARSPRALAPPSEAVTAATFIALASIWGSSFMFIRIGLDEGVRVYTMVSVRTISAALLLGIVLMLMRGGLPGTREATETAFAQVALGAVVLTLLAVFLERPADGLYALPPSLDAWFALLWLGILSTGVAYVLFYRIISAWGATRTTLVTYVLPVVAIALGFVSLGERLVLLELGGAVLVLLGVVLVNASVGRRVLFGRRATVDGSADVV